MAHQDRFPNLSDEEASQDSSADAEKAEYRARLREYLKDPEFRKIEGFPIGTDEDILALSDPPYYTACPNPFLPEIIERWQEERRRLCADLGLPDDSDDNGHSAATGNGAGSYHREPFAADVSEGKNDPIYNAHSYHTKVPHKAIMRYILHYTEPGDIVFDGFCGTGMTGVAAQLCGDRAKVEELGYRVDVDGTIYDGQKAISRLGARKAVLTDLSPAATFIAYNYNTPVDVAKFEREAERILQIVEGECGWMYETWHPHNDHPNRAKGKINYTVWSDVFVCPECGSEMVFWDVAVDKDAGAVRDEFPCPRCGVEQTKRRLERAWETAFDHTLGKTIQRAKQVPVLINYTISSRRFEKSPDNSDLALIQRIESSNVLDWFPTAAIPKGDKTSDPFNAGVTHVHHFYTRRSLSVFVSLWHSAYDPIVKAALLGGLSVGLKMARFRVPLWVNRTSGPMKGLTPGTLYLPSVSGEQNWLNILKERIAAIQRQLDEMNTTRPPAGIATQSATSLNLQEKSVQYVFVDPPFGHNLIYSELNLVNEAWLKVLTNKGPEALISQNQHKGLSDYQRLMEQCFREFYRALKPGHWMTVEFHNSQNRVWNAIQEAVLRAGFVVADVRTFDKQQGTFNQVNATGAVKQDLIISAYRPRADFERGFLAEAGTPEGAWAFVRQHLAQLPVVVEVDGTIQVVAERQPYLLFDRMVAFHIQRGATVPMSASEFYAGLQVRFDPSDGMFFLPDQVLKYERARLQAKQVGQLAIFVSDEKSAINWLRQQLDPSMGGKPQTYQDILPSFLRHLHQARHEALPELSVMLDQNFLQDERGRWYVPDPNKASDLEKIRLRALLREFAQYVEGRGKLRQFRTEAVRAGFAEAWRQRDYATIVRVAHRLPELVLQEDPDLLMYYDNASLRVE